MGKAVMAMAQFSAAANGSMSQGVNSILPRIQTVKTESIVKVNDGILNGIWQNPQTFPFHIAFQEFATSSAKVVDELTVLKSEVEAAVQIRNNEEHKRAFGIKRASITLEQLQTYCGELAAVIFQFYLQLGRAKELLLQIGNTSFLPTVEKSTEQAIALLGEILNASFVVEGMSSQLVRKTKGEGTMNEVVVSLLIGEKLNVRTNPPQLTVSIVSEKNEWEPVADGVKGMEWNEKSKRLSVKFEKMKLTELKKGDNSKKDKLVMEEKFFLHFCGEITVRGENLQPSLTFHVSARSMPFVWSSHGTQDATATAAIVGYNTFGDSTTVRWTDFVEILIAQVVKSTGRELTHIKHRTFLAKMAFGDKRLHPETTSWSELCKKKLPNKNFTFWTWFHATLKLLDKKEFKELFREGYIEFIDKDSAAEIVFNHEAGTFVIRPSGSFLGRFSLSAIVASEGGGPCQIVHVEPNDPKDPLDSILNAKDLTWVFQGQRCIPKADAFQRFCAQAKVSAAPIREGYSRMESNIVLVSNADASQRLPSIQRPEELCRPPAPCYSQPPPESPQASSSPDRTAAYTTFPMETTVNTLASPNTTGPSYTVGGSPASEAAFENASWANYQVFEPPFYPDGRLETYDLTASCNEDLMEINYF